MCSEKYKDASEFLYHFETHMNQNEETENDQHNVSHRKNFLKFKSDNDDEQNENKEIEHDESLKKQSSKQKKSIQKIATCESCNKRFAGKQSLRMHIITFHEKLKGHKCDICSKTFGRRKALQNHINAVYTYYLV